MAGVEGAGPTPVKPTDAKHSLLATLLIGVGLMAAIDEIVFHQVLAWHHFFDRSTPAVGLLSDGFLHAAELIFLVGGFFWFTDLNRRHCLARQSAWAGLLIGLGSFQLFDGVVDHKLLRLHQVRYVDTLWPYDVAWITVGIVLLAGGLLLSTRGKSTRMR